MRYVQPIIPLAAMLAVLGCGDGRDPVAEDAVAPPPEVAGDAGATGVAAPANAGVAAAIDAAALPGATDGMRWIASSDGAVFGAEGGVRMLTLECQPGARQLIVTRHAGAPDNGKGTLSVTGSGHATSLPVAAARSADGAMEWRGTASGDIARSFGRAFAIDGPVQMKIGGAPDLIATADATVRAIIQRCIAG